MKFYPIKLKNFSFYANMIVLIKLIRKRADFMSNNIKELNSEKKTNENHLLRFLDRGIDDMEANRVLPLEEAFEKITELRNKRRDARN